MSYHDEDEEEYYYDDVTENAKYKEGDKVKYRGSFGCGPTEVVIIEGIDEKNGEVVYDLSNGHWCYESQIICLV